MLFYGLTFLLQQYVILTSCYVISYCKMRRQRPGYRHMDDCQPLYGDVQRTFGSDWHKEWQGNVGLN